MKKIIKILLFLLSLVILVLTGLVAVLFFSPTTLINPSNINLVLEKSKVLKSWSWKEANISHKWVSWKERQVSGHFKDLCFEYQSPAMEINTCFSEISWNFDLLYNAESGVHARTRSPLRVFSPLTSVILHKVPGEKVEPATPPNIWRYWSLLWSDMVPDMKVDFKTIKLVSEDKPTEFDIKLTKFPKKLTAQALGFTLLANPKSFTLLAPKSYLLPFKNQTLGPLRLLGFKLNGQVSESGIPLTATGAIEPIEFQLKSRLQLPLQDDFASVAFRKKMMLATSASLQILDVNQSLKKHGPGAYTKLPAPFNEMNGSIKSQITSHQQPDAESVLFKAITAIDLKSERQSFQLDILVDAPINARTFSPGAVVVGIDFKKISLLLPRISKKSLPPQFKPDGRIRNAPFAPALEAKKANPQSSLSFHLQALNERALHLKTNLLDEVLRLNFDLLVEKGEMQKGFLEVLPLKTTIFKRPIRIDYLKITFNYPLEPVIEATLKFPLPEFKITLKLEGPISKPRYAFSSVPPLPQNDIYAVLLFGRPMTELDPDDKGAAQQTNQILSQGILSLSVLYFLAGSPVEYVGYDPNSSNATAQIGLGSKNSLRVGAGSGGVNSTAVRRSLGKGWYLDTSVQSPSSGSSRDEKNYGVMLERIIAY